MKTQSTLRYLLFSFVFTLISLPNRSYAQPDSSMVINGPTIKFAYTEYGIINYIGLCHVQSTPNKRQSISSEISIGFQPITEIIGINIEFTKSFHWLRYGLLFHFDTDFNGVLYGGTPMLGINLNKMLALSAGYRVNFINYIDFDSETNWERSIYLRMGVFIPIKQ